MVKNSIRTAIVLFSVTVSLSLPGTALAAGRVFYDSFESGNTNQWAQDEYRNRCQVVTSASDGGASPVGTRMLRCGDDGTKAWNDAAAYESLALNSISYTNELFIRTKVRRDSNLQITSSSPKKIMRIFNWTGNQNTYNDLYESFYSGSGGLVNTGIAGGSQLATYWGSKSGDSTASSSGWHEIEYYISTSGVVKVWHDGVLVQTFTGQKTGNSKWLPFTITSNWSDSHDATNYIYFDEFEVFTDTGVGATGSMSDGTVSASGSPVPISAPTNLRVN